MPVAAAAAAAAQRATLPTGHPPSHPASTSRPLLAQRPSLMDAICQTVSVQSVHGGSSPKEVKVLDYKNSSSRTSPTILACDAPILRNLGDWRSRSASLHLGPPGS